MSAPRGLGRGFLAVFLSFSLLPLPPAGLVAPAFAQEDEPQSEPPKTTVVASASIGQPNPATPGLAAPDPAARPPETPPNPDAAKVADVLKTFAAAAAPLKEAALASDAVKAMASAYAAAAKILADVAQRLADDKAVQEAKKRAEALAPLVEAKKANDELRTLTAGLEETLKLSPSDTAVDWKAFDKALARLNEVSARADALGAAAKGRGEGVEGWGDDPPPADMRKLHVEASAVMAGELRDLSARWRPIREFALARPGTQTGDAADKIVRDLAAAVPETAQPALARDLGQLKSRIAGLALDGADPAAVNREFRRFFERAGLTGERLEAATDLLAQGARREGANLTAAAIPAGLLTPADQVPLRPGQGPALAVPDPNALPGAAAKPQPGLVLPQQLNAATVNAGRMLLAMLPAPPGGATLTDVAASAFAAARLAVVPPLITPTNQSRLGETLAKVADAADREAAGLRRERAAAAAETAAAQLEAASNASSSAGMPGVAGFTDLDAKLKALREDPALAALPEAERRAFLARLDALDARARAAGTTAQRRREESAAAKAERTAPVEELLARVETLKASGDPAWEAEAGKIARRMAELRAAQEKGPALLDEDGAAVAARWTELRQAMSGWMGGRLPGAYGALSEEVHSLISDAPNRLGGASKADVDAWRARADALSLRLFGDPKKGAAGREGSEWARLELLADGLGADGPEALAAARARAASLRGLLDAMKQGGVDPTTLPPEMKALFLGTVRESQEKTADGANARLGLLGQAVLAQKGRGDSLAVLMTALEKNVDLDAPNLEGRLAEFFENVKQGKVSVVFEGSRRTVSFEGTDLAPVISRFAASRPQGPATGTPADPALPVPGAAAGPTSAGRDLIAVLQGLRADFKSPADRARAGIYLSHDNLNRSVYDYLKALPEGDAERAKYADFMKGYEALAARGFDTSPGLGSIRRQQDLTDLARPLLTRFPEQEAYVRSQVAMQGVQAGLEGLDPAAVALLAANGAPDTANLAQRTDKQAVLNAGVAAYGMKLHERDPAAWASARDQLLTYFYGSGYDAAVTAQRDQLRRAAGAGDVAALGEALDGVVSPVVRVAGADGKPETSVFITSGFLKEVPAFLERRAAGKATTRDQSLSAAWDSLAERLKSQGASDEQVAALAADPARLAGALRASGVPVYDRALLEAAAGRGTGSPEEAAALRQAAALYGVSGDPSTDAGARAKVLAALTGDLGGAKADAVEQGRRDQLLFTSSDETRARLRQVEAAADKAGGEHVDGLVAGMSAFGEGEPTLQQLRARKAAYDRSMEAYGLKGEPGEQSYRDLAWRMMADRARLADLPANATGEAKEERDAIVARLSAAERFAGVGAEQRAQLNAAVRTDSFRSLVALRDSLTDQRQAGDEFAAVMGRMLSLPGGKERQALSGNFYAVRAVTGAALRDRDVPIEGLRTSGWILGYDKVTEVVRRTAYVSGDGTARGMTDRPETVNQTTGDRVRAPTLGDTRRDGLSFHYDAGRDGSLPLSARTWRFESLDGRFRETHAPEMTRLAERFGDKPVEVYRDAQGRTVYRVQGTSDYFWLPPDPSIPVTKVDPRTVGVRRVEKLTVETRADPSAEFSTGTLTYYQAQAGDRVIAGRVADGVRQRTTQGGSGAVLVAYEQKTSDGSIRVDYENGTQFVRKGDTGWSFALSGDWKGQAESRSRTVIDLSGGQSKVLYTEFLQKGEKDGRETWTLMRSETERDAASRASLNATVRIGDRTSVSWADFDAQARRDFQGEAAGRMLQRRGDAKVESLGVSFERKPGEDVSPERMRAAAALVRSRLSVGDSWLRDRGNAASIEGDFQSLMGMFDGQRAKNGSVTTYDASYTFSAGSGTGAQRSGVNATATLSHYDAANGRTSQTSRNFTYTDFSQLPTDPDKYPTDPRGPDSPQLRDARNQAHGTLRLMGIRDYTRKPGAFVEYTRAAPSRIGGDGKEKTVMIASSFLHNGRLLKVDHQTGDPKEVGGTWYWAGDQVREVYIQDQDGTTLRTTSYKVGDTTSIWNAARKGGDYVSGSIRYTDFGERNPITAAVLGGIAGGLIEGIADPMNLVMLGGVYTVGKIALKTATATSRTLKTINVVANTIVRAAPVGMRVMMGVQGGMGTFNMGYGLATGNADMVANGARGLTMLLPLEGVYQGMGKIAKMTFEKPKIPDIPVRAPDPVRPPDVGAKPPEPVRPPEAPVKPPEPPVKPPEPPVKPPEPPARPPEPPAKPPEPPAKPPEPPAKPPEPPAKPPEPPARPPDPPARPPEPPARPPEPAPPSPAPEPFRPMEPPASQSQQLALGAPAPAAPSRMGGVPGSARGGFDGASTLSNPDAAGGFRGDGNNSTQFFGGNGKPGAPSPAAQAAVAAAPAAAPPPVLKAAPPEAPRSVEAPRPAQAPAAPAQAPAPPARVAEAPQAAPRPVDAPAPAAARPQFDPPQPFAAAAQLGAPAAALPAPRAELPVAAKGLDAPAPVRRPAATAVPDAPVSARVAPPPAKGFEAPKAVDAPAKADAPAAVRPPAEAPPALRDAAPTKAPDPLPRTESFRPEPAPSAAPKDADVVRQDLAPAVGGGGAQAAPRAPPASGAVDRFLVRIEAVGAKYMPTFAKAAAAPSKGLEAAHRFADLAPARFAAWAPKTTAAWRQTTGVLNAPFHALGALGARVSAWGQAPGRNRVIGALADVAGMSIQGVRADGKHAMSREETLHPRVQDRPGFQTALKDAEFKGGEATLYAKADPVTGRLTDYSASPRSGDGGVLVEVRVERGPKGDRVADVAVSPLSRVQPTRFGAERLESLREVSTLDLDARLAASRLVGGEDFKARVLDAAKADPVDRAADLTLRWDPVAGRWGTDGDGPGMRLLLEPDAAGAYRLVGARPTGPLPESARLTLESALQSELRLGLEAPRGAAAADASPARLDAAGADAAWTAADRAFRADLLAAKSDFRKASAEADAELSALRGRADTAEGRAAYDAAVARRKDALRAAADQLSAKGGDPEYGPLAQARQAREAAWNKPTSAERVAALREADARFAAAAAEAKALGLTTHARAEGVALRAAAAEALRRDGGDPVAVEARERMTEAWKDLDAARGTPREGAAARRAADAEADAALLAEGGARIDVTAERAAFDARRDPDSFAALEPGLRARAEAVLRREAGAEAAAELARLTSLRETRAQARERLASSEKDLAALGVDPKRVDDLDAARAEALREFGRLRADAEAAPKERSAEAWDKADAAYRKLKDVEGETGALLDRAGAGQPRVHALLEARAAAKDDLARAGAELLPAALARRVAPPKGRAEADYVGALRAAAEADALGRKRQGYRMRGMSADVADAKASFALREARGRAARGEDYGRGRRVAYQGDGLMTCSLHSYANHMGLRYGEVEGILRGRLGDGFLARVERYGLSPTDIRRVGQLLAAEKGLSFDAVAAGEVFSRAAKGERFGVVINAANAASGGGGGPHMVSLERVVTDASGRTFVEFKDSLVRGDGRPVRMRIEDFVPLMTRTPAVAIGARKASDADLALYRDAAAPLVARFAGPAGPQVGAANPRLPGAPDGGPAPKRGLTALFDRLRRSADTNAVTERSGRSAVEAPPASAYERLPRSLLDTVEASYAVTMKAATPAELAKLDRTSEADPAWWSDHGPNHVRNIVENMAAIIKQAPQAGLIAPRDAARADFMEKAGGVSAALHDMWMKDLTGRGRKLHPSRASREAFAATLDKAAADLEALPMADGRTFADVLKTDYGIPPGEVSRVTREVMAMSYAHSKSNVPLGTLNDPKLLRQAMVDVTTSRDGATSKIKADEGVASEALPGELQPYRRFYERGGKDEFDALAFDWLTNNPKLAADVTDLSRALRVADALRWRGSSDFRGSQGANIGIARLGENPRTYMRLADPETGKTYMVLYDSKLAMGEANIRTAQMTADGGLKFAFESGRFGSAAGDAKVADGTAHVIFDVYKDYVMSFNKVGDRPIVIERPRGEAPGFTEKVVDGLRALAKAEKDPFFAKDLEARLAEGTLSIKEAPAEDLALLKDRTEASALEEARFLEARPYRPNADSLNVLARMAEAAGVEVSRISFKHALEGARVVTLAPGETLLTRGSPPGYVYVPLSEGLSVRLGQGYKPSPLKPGAPVGELSALAQAPRNADISALPAGAPGAKPAVSVLAIPREVYLREWTRGYYDHSTILPRLKKDYGVGTQTAGREKGAAEVGAAWFGRKPAAEPAPARPAVPSRPLEPEAVARRVAAGPTSQQDALGQAQLKEFFTRNLPLWERLDALKGLSGAELRAAEARPLDSFMTPAQAAAKADAVVAELGARFQKAEVNINFDPNAKLADGRTVLEAWAADTHYRNAHETGNSGGLQLSQRRTAVEDAMFPELAGRGGAERPKYAALNLAGDPKGAAPRYGEAYLTLKPEVRRRATMTPEDSLDMAPLKPGSDMSFVAGNVHALDKPYGLLRRMDASSYASLVRADKGAKAPYVEVQVQGPVRFNGDVQAVNAPAAWRGTPTGAKLEAFAKQNGAEMRWFGDAPKRGAAEVGAAEPVREVWGREREALALKLASSRGMETAAALKAIDAHNRSLGLGPSIFEGHPAQVSSHFERMAKDDEFLSALPKAKPQAAGAAPGSAPAAAPRAPPADTSHPVGALDAIDAALAKPGAAQKAAADPALFKKAADALLQRVQSWRAGPDGAATRSAGGTNNLVKAQQEYSAALLKGAREFVARAGLDGDKVITNGTTMDALLGILMAGRIEATNPHRGFSGESAQVWGAHGLEGGASYGAKRGVGRDQPGVLLIIDNPKDPIKVVGGETLSRAPTVKDDIRAAVVSDGRRTFVIEGEALRALSASAERWRGAVNERAQAGDMSEFMAYDRLQRRLSAEGVSKADYGGRNAEVGAADYGRGADAAGRARSATDELVASVKRARSARPDILPEGTLLHGTSEAALRRILASGKMLPSVGKGNVMYGEAVYAEVFSSKGAEAVLGGPLYALRTYGRQAAVEAARAGSPDHRPVLLRIKGESVQRPSQMSKYIDGAPVQGSAALSKAEVRSLWEKLPLAEQRATTFDAFAARFKTEPAGLLGRLFGAGDAGPGKVGGVPVEHLEAFDAAAGRWVPAKDYRFGARRGPGEVGAAERPALERYFSQDEFRRIHPKEDDVYHDWHHSLKVGDMAYDFAAARGLSDADAKFVREVALLHDIDPSRAPGAPARVPATLEALRKDFAGEVSLTGEAGRSLLRERFGWDPKHLAMAEAMIQRTEFPFADSHPNPFYKDASPLARYEAMLKALPEGDRAFALREGALLSEYADKSSWYATESFPGAMKVVEGLAHEINTASGGKAQMTAAKLDTASFLSVLGEPKSFELDVALAARVGLPAPVLPNRAQAWKLLGGDYGARFEANIKGFEAYKDALAGGAAHDAAAARGADLADGAFTALRGRGADASGRSPREGEGEVGGAREVWGRLKALPGTVVRRGLVEAFGDAGGRLYLSRTFSGLVPGGAPDAIIRRAVRATLAEEGSVVGLFEAHRLDRQSFSDCSVRANYNHPMLAPVREVLTYDEFLRLNEALAGARLRDTGTYHFQKGHVLQALGYKLGDEWVHHSAESLVDALRQDGALFASITFTMPRILSPTSPFGAHAVVLNGAIHEKGWAHAAAAASERGWLKTGWDLLRSPLKTARELRDGGVWRFVVSDSNMTAPTTYTFRQLKDMNINVAALMPRHKRVPGQGLVEMTAADHRQRAADLKARLAEVEVSPSPAKSSLAERLSIGRQAALDEAPVLMRADRKALLDFEGWAGQGKRLEVLPVAEARRQYPQVAKRVGEGYFSHVVVDPANPDRFTILAGVGDAVVLGRRGDGRFRWPLGVRNEVVRLSLEADGLKVERLDSHNQTRVRGARLKVLEAAGAETVGRSGPESGRGSEVGASERPKAADVWRQEREGLAARLAAARGIAPDAAAKAIDAFNAELGLGPGIFSGMPDRVTDHFGRMASNPDLLKRLPKGVPQAAAPAPGAQAAGRAAPELPALSAALKPADPAKLGTMEAAFKVVDEAGRSSFLKTTLYRGAEAGDVGDLNARIRAEAEVTAALERAFNDPAKAPGAPKPAGVAVPKVLGAGVLPPALAKALYGPRAPQGLEGMQLETLPGRMLQSYLSLETGAYRRPDGKPVVLESDFRRLEGAVRRMHELGFAWGDLHDGQLLMRGEAGRIEWGLIDFGSMKRRGAPGADWEAVRADDLQRLADLKASLFDDAAPRGGYEVGAAEWVTKALELNTRANLALGKGLYRITGGSLGIIPRSFGVKDNGQPLIILERKTPPFSQLLPAAWRPRHYLSIGVNSAPDLATKKALVRAFAELTAPETLKALGVGEPGGAAGFRVVTDNPALVTFAKRYEGEGWKVVPYEGAATTLDKVQHLLQHPFGPPRRLAERLLGISRPDGRHVITRDYSPAPASADAPLPDAGAPRALPGPAAGVLPIPEAPGNLLRGVRGAAGDNLLNAPNSPRAPPADIGAALPRTGGAEELAAAGPKPLRDVFNPLAADEVIVDANIAVALDRAAKGRPLKVEDEAFIRRLGSLGARQPEQALKETGYQNVNGVLPISTGRESPEYRAVLGALDLANVGRRKGDSDRQIVADAFFAVTAGGATPRFMTGDAGVYKALARMAGHDLQKLGKPVHEAFPDGFDVTVEGRTLRVIPAHK